MRPISLYIHIPFCKRRCPYCTFYHEPYTEALEERFVSSACGEIASAFEFLEDRNAEEPGGGVYLRTVYFGGGTPSVLKRSSIDKLFAKVLERAESAEEITFELNPEDVSASRLDFLKGLGVNRISLGIQSMNASALSTLSRCSGKSNEKALELAKSRFENINVDLLLGIPGSSLKDTEGTLDGILEYEPVHFSVYCLEADSKSSAPVRSFLSAVDEERMTEEYLFVSTRLEVLGYVHYEASNFAQPGFESKHNKTYWEGGEYVGIGPGAHSYIGGRRLFNEPFLEKYIGDSRLGFRERKRADDLDKKSALLEGFMLGLRTRSGIPVDSSGCDPGIVRKLADDGLAHVRDGRLVLSNRGYLLLDEIVLRLLPREKDLI